MAITRQDTTSARTPSPQFSTNGFDCQLPPEVIDELRRRGRPPSPPIRPPTLFIPFRQAPGVRGIVLALLGLALVVAIIVASTWRQPSQPANVVASAPVAQSTPALPAGWNADGTAQGRAGVIPVVRRAEQVLRVGRWNQVFMPDGQLTWVRFWGVANTFADLPSNPQIGDAFGVREGGQHALWVWHQLPNHVRAEWVDP